MKIFFGLVCTSSLMMAASNLQVVYGFTPSSISDHQGVLLPFRTMVDLPAVLPSPQIRSTSALMMAKKAGKKSGNKGGSTSSGGGFGSTTKNNGSNPQQQQQRTRSLSQHSPGAGTKPLRTAANTFDALRKEFGKDCTNDVYCRSPDNDRETFWYVGKVAVRPGTSATPDQAVISQKRLILEYSKSELRPQNFAGRYAQNLELWLAPGDSEMDAVQNKVSLVKVDGSMSDLADDFNVKHVGFNPEIYVVRNQNVVLDTIVGCCDVLYKQCLLPDDRNQNLEQSLFPVGSERQLHHSHSSFLFALFVG
jgi:hypothetical protein